MVDTGRRGRPTETMTDPPTLLNGPEAQIVFLPHAMSHCEKNAVHLMQVWGLRATSSMELKQHPPLREVSNSGMDRILH